MRGSGKVYQFKITLRYIEPPIWRRIQVPGTYTFWDLHVAIQDAMGWEDYHLHEFVMRHPKMGGVWRICTPFEEDLLTADVRHEREERIADWFTEDNRRALYRYDFGDSWEHWVELEEILPEEAGIDYPRCVGGARACPPEDCGGVGGYEAIVSGKSEFMEHYRDYDPERFDPKKVEFDDPEFRWRLAWEFLGDVE